MPEGGMIHQPGKIVDVFLFSDSAPKQVRELTFLKVETRLWAGNYKDLLRANGQKCKIVGGEFSPPTAGQIILHVRGRDETFVVGEDVTLLLSQSEAS